MNVKRLLLFLNFHRIDIDFEAAQEILSLLPSNYPDPVNDPFHCLASYLNFINGYSYSTTIPSFECSTTLELLKSYNSSTFQDILFQISFYLQKSSHLSSLSLDEILSSKFFCLLRCHSIDSVLPLIICWSYQEFNLFILLL